MKINKNYENLEDSYLFSTIAKKVSEFVSVVKSKFESLFKIFKNKNCVADVFSRIELFIATGMNPLHQVQSASVVHGAVSDTRHKVYLDITLLLFIKIRYIF